MPFTVTLPKLSPTMEDGTIVKWHKKEGDHVKAGDLLIEVATDKATVEYNALDDGWLKKVLITDGKSALVNQPIAIFTEEENESVEGYQPVGVMPAKKEEVATRAAATEKKTEKQPAMASGISQPAFVPESPLEDYQFERPTETMEKRVKASPLARKLARERGLDITSVKGTGPGQRIVSKDLEIAQPSSAFVFGKREAPTEQPGSYEEEELSPMRKKIGQRLQESKTFIPHFYVQQTVNAQPLVSIREQLQNLEIKLTVNDFIVKAAALALRDHPNVNAGFNSVNQTVVKFKTIDIAVAVSVNGGLITPIVRHADYKNLGELSAEVRNLAKKAKDGKLEPHEYKGGSFTVSNLGMYGVSDFQAIINPPQAAILAISGIQEVPVVSKGAIVPGKTMNITLSADHRVVDGVAAAEFIKTVQKYLENPAALMI